MFSMKKISAAAVGLALMASVHPAAAESVYTQQGSSSGAYLFQTYNNSKQDIWVTYYNAVTRNHEGEACIPPGQHGGIASNDWGTVGAYVQIEVKKGANCGGSNYADFENLGYSAGGNGWMVTKSGTSHITFSGDINDYHYSFSE